ncbi:MAG TPA: VWA domain-containing protein [Gaiellaceae bacterium]|nr:VWA domain-containing protein [Gaiellaceae bacterium]
MSFGHPLLLLTLLAVPLAAGVYLYLQRRPARYAMTFTNLDVLASVAGGRRWLRYLAPALFLLALASLCFALARPHRSTLVASKRSTVILVIDVSGSMQANDVRPTRLGAAQAAARTFLDKVPKSVRVGLIAFAGEPQVAAPPTTDHDLVRQSLDTLSLFSGFGGTAIGDALAAAVELAGPQKPAGAQTIAYRIAASSSSTSILFLSDGHQTRGLLEPLQGAERAQQAGIPVYTVALGTPNGVLNTGQFGGFGQGRGPIPVPPDPETLSDIARTTGGQFFEARNARSLSSAYSHLGARLGREPGKTEITYQFLAIGAGLLLAAGLLSALTSPRLP